MSYFTRFENQSFRSARELVRNGMPRKLAELIKHQPGYRVGSEMALARAKTGGWRLYTRQGGAWTVASLDDMQEPAVCEAAVELGHRTSPKKALAARENGKKGGRPPKGGKNADI